MTLGEKQELLFRLDAQFRTYLLKLCEIHKVSVREGEGPVAPLRKVHVDGKLLKVRDAEHITLSAHYNRLAHHYYFFKPDPADGKVKPIWDASHPAYLDAGKYWESLHELCSWGGNWDRDDVPLEPGETDVGHFSLEHEGVK